MLYLIALLYTVAAQPHIPPPTIPDCTEGWQSPDLTYVPAISQCSDYSNGAGVPCNPLNPSSCTGRNPFCSSKDGSKTGPFKCCSDRIQDSDDLPNLRAEEIKPICPGGAIPYRMPHVMLCDPSIVNMCPHDYKCVEAANGNHLPADGRSLCCKTSTLYAFSQVFIEAKLTPLIIPAPPIQAIDYVTLNVHTSSNSHSPDIRTGDHFVLAPYRLLEPAYLKKVHLLHDQSEGSYLHVIIFNPMSRSEHMQFYYDRPSRSGKVLDLTEPIADGGFISKIVMNTQPAQVMQNPNRPGANYRRMWVVLMFKTVDPIGRLYVSVTKDLHSQYKTVTQFLKSDTGKMLGTPIAGTFFYLTTE